VILCVCDVAWCNVLLGGMFLTTSPSSPHLVSMTFTSLGGSTKVQTWFLSKFSQLLMHGIDPTRIRKSVSNISRLKEGNK
jgi:hypothetical protein